MTGTGRGFVIRLVRTAAEQTKLEGIGEILRVVTEEMNAWGTLIWAIAPVVNNSKQKPPNHFALM